MKKDKRRPGFVRFLRGFFLALSLLAVAALVASAYGGMVSPLKHGGAWGILPLCLEPCMFICLALLAIQLLWHWRGVVIIVLGFLACAWPCLEVCPLNVRFGPRKASEGSAVFSLMTYNVHNFSLPPAYRDSDNAMIDYILETQPDVVCLQEAGPLGIYASGNITAEQMKKLHSVYPEIIKGGSAQAVLSKYPVKPIHLITTREEFNDADINAFRLSLPGGRIVTVFNVHLQSFELTNNDRELYRELTDLQKQPLRDVKTRLFDKLCHANVERARQTQALLRFIRHYGGPDVIICGDFNDVSTCYSIRTLEDAGFSEVYEAVGFGPIITYNASRFYFGIDHVLYKGDIMPLSLTKGRLKASDHYPVTVSLAVE